MKNIITLSIVFLSTITCVFSQWVQRASLPAGTARHHPVNFVLDYKAYFLTGMNSSNQVLKDFYVYDPDNDAWTKKTDFPGTARGFAYGASYNGKGYIGFGLGPSSYLNDLWEYDPVADSWTQLSSCPCVGRRHPAFIAINGKIFVGLGDAPGANLNDWWEYDIALDEWNSAAGFPGVVRHHPFYFGIDNDAYVGFGHGASIYKDFYKYNLSSKSWTRMNDFPGEQRVAGTQQAYNGKGYILGGDGADHNNLDTGEFYEYDPTTDTWTELTPYPGQGRWAPGSFTIGNRMYITAGETGNGTLWNDLWSYDIFPAAVGINEVSNKGEDFTIYPNPATNEITLPSDLKLDGRTEISIFSAQGKLVYKNVLISNRVDISSLNPQMYLVQINNEKGLLYRSRFAKQ